MNNNGSVVVEPIVVEAVRIEVTEIQGPRGQQGIPGPQGPPGPPGAGGVTDPLLSHYTNDVPFLEVADYVAPVNADWDSISGLSQILNKPTQLSDFSNDVGFITGIDFGMVTTALGYTPENPANKGLANGYAPLDATAKIAALYLPAYVDDVLEYSNLASFPSPGSAGIIYVALDTNKTYRWGGSSYIEISPSPGSTDAVPEGSVNLYYTNARVLSYITGLNVSLFANDAGYVTASSSTLFTNKSGNISQWTNNSGYITASSSDLLTNKSGNISQWTNNSGYLTTSTGAASVANSDGTLTISPTQGAVVASLALGHANVWTAKQEMRLTTEQLRLSYDVSHSVTFTVDSTGNLTLGGSSSQLLTHGIGVNLDGQGVVVSTGQKGYIRIPYNATITAWSIVADVSGSCVFDVWKAAGALPTVSNTITASAKPTLSSNTIATSSTLTGWTTAILAGDVIGWNLDSASTVTRVILQLTITRT